MQIAEGSRGTGRLVSASEGVRLRRPLSRGEAGVNYLLWRTQQERERVRGGATSAVIERTDQDSRYTELPQESHQTGRSMEPRSYQAEAFDAARKSNVVMVGATGVGKTLVALMLIRDFYFEDARRREDKTRKWCVFLCPTQELVFQQARSAQIFTGVRCGPYVGKDLDYWGLEKWRAEIDSKEVLVMTPNALLNLLHRGRDYLSLEDVGVLVFDECHQARKKHPYARVMAFYLELQGKGAVVPKVFGMTASPTVECVEIMRCKAYVCEDELIEEYQANAEWEVLLYDSFIPSKTIVRELEGLMRMIFSESMCGYKSTKEKFVTIVVMPVLFSYQHLGLWCAIRHVVMFCEGYLRSRLAQTTKYRTRTVRVNKVTTELIRRLLESRLGFAVCGVDRPHAPPPSPVLSSSASSPSTSGKGSADGKTDSVGDDTDGTTSYGDGAADGAAAGAVAASDIEANTVSGETDLEREGATRTTSPTSGLEDRTESGAYDATTSVCDISGEPCRERGRHDAHEVQADVSPMEDDDAEESGAGEHEGTRNESGGDDARGDRSDDVDPAAMAAEWGKTPARVSSLVRTLLRVAEDWGDDAKNFRCMIFVERRATARVLCEYLSHSLTGRFRCGFVVGRAKARGTNVHGGAVPIRNRNRTLWKPRPDDIDKGSESQKEPEAQATKTTPDTVTGTASDKSQVPKTPLDVKSIIEGGAGEGRDGGRREARIVGEGKRKGKRRQGIDEEDDEDIEDDDDDDALDEAGSFGAGGLRDRRGRVQSGAQRDGEDGRGLSGVAHTINLFRVGEVQILVTTDACSEGIDVPECNLVISMDKLKTSRTLIHTRGRARSKGGKFVIMIQGNDEVERDRVNQMLVEAEDIKRFQLGDEKASTRVPLRTSHPGMVHRIESTGAVVDMDMSTALLHEALAAIGCDFHPLLVANERIKSSGQEGKKSRLPSFMCRLELPSFLSIPTLDTETVNEHFWTKAQARCAVTYLAVLELLKKGLIDERLNPSRTKDRLVVETRRGYDPVLVEGRDARAKAAMPIPRPIAMGILPTPSVDFELARLAARGADLLPHMGKIRALDASGEAGGDNVDGGCSGNDERLESGRGDEAGVESFGGVTGSAHDGEIEDRRPRLSADRNASGAESNTFVIHGSGDKSGDVDMLTAPEVGDAKSVVTAEKSAAAVGHDGSVSGVVGAAADGGMVGRITFTAVAPAGTSSEAIEASGNTADEANARTKAEATAQAQGEATVQATADARNDSATELEAESNGRAVSRATTQAETYEERAAEFPTDCSAEEVAAKAAGSGSAVWRNAWVRGCYENIPGPKRCMRIYCFRSPPGEVDGWIPTANEPNAGFGDVGEVTVQKGEGEKGDGDAEEDEHEADLRTFHPNLKVDLGRGPGKGLGPRLFVGMASAAPLPLTASQANKLGVEGSFDEYLNLAQMAAIVQWHRETLGMAALYKIPHQVTRTPLDDPTKSPFRDASQVGDKGVLVVPLEFGEEGLGDGAPRIDWAAIEAANAGVQVPDPADGEHDQRILFSRVSHKTCRFQFILERTDVTLGDYLMRCLESDSGPYAGLPSEMLTSHAAGRMGRIKGILAVGHGVRKPDYEAADKSQRLLLAVPAPALRHSFAQHLIRGEKIMDPDAGVRNRVKMRSGQGGPTDDGEQDVAVEDEGKTPEDETAKGSGGKSGEIVARPASLEGMNIGGDTGDHGDDHDMTDAATVPTSTSPDQSTMTSRSARAGASSPKDISAAPADDKAGDDGEELGKEWTGVSTLKPNSHKIGPGQPVLLVEQYCQPICITRRVFVSVLHVVPRMFDLERQLLCFVLHESLFLPALRTSLYHHRPRGRLEADDIDGDDKDDEMMDNMSVNGDTRPDGGMSSVDDGGVLAASGDHQSAGDTEDNVFSDQAVESSVAGTSEVTDGAGNCPAVCFAELGSRGDPPHLSFAPDKVQLSSSPAPHPSAMSPALASSATETEEKVTEWPPNGTWSIPGQGAGTGSGPGGAPDLVGTGNTAAAGVEEAAEGGAAAAAQAAAMGVIQWDGDKDGAVADTIALLDCSLRRPVNERLETLGDAWLNYYAGFVVFQDKPVLMEEGMMTLLRKNVVSNARLIKCADGRGLREFMYPPRSILGRPFEMWAPSLLPLPPTVKANRKTIADVVEALLGAALVAGGNRSAAYLMEWLGLPTLEASNDPDKGKSDVDADALADPAAPDDSATPCGNIISESQPQQHADGESSAEGLSGAALAAAAVPGPGGPAGEAGTGDREGQRSSQLSSEMQVDAETVPVKPLTIAAPSAATTSAALEDGNESDGCQEAISTRNRSGPAYSVSTAPDGNDCRDDPMDQDDGPKDELGGDRSGGGHDSSAIGGTGMIGFAATAMATPTAAVEALPMPKTALNDPQTASSISSSSSPTSGLWSDSSSETTVSVVSSTIHSSSAGASGSVESESQEGLQLTRSSGNSRQEKIAEVEASTAAKRKVGAVRVGDESLPSSKCIRTPDRLSPASSRDGSAAEGEEEEEIKEDREKETNGLTGDSPGGNIEKVNATGEAEGDAHPTATSARTGGAAGIMDDMEVNSNRDEERTRGVDTCEDGGDGDVSVSCANNADDDGDDDASSTCTINEGDSQHAENDGRNASNFVHGDDNGNSESRGDRAAARRCRPKNALPNHVPDVDDRERPWLWKPPAYLTSEPGRFGEFDDDSEDDNAEMQLFGGTHTGALRQVAKEDGGNVAKVSASAHPVGQVAATAADSAPLPQSSVLTAAVPRGQLSSAPELLPPDSTSSQEGQNSTDRMDETDFVEEVSEIPSDEAAGGKIADQQTKKEIPPANVGHAAAEWQTATGKNSNKRTKKRTKAARKKLWAGLMLEGLRGSAQWPIRREPLMSAEFLADTGVLPKVYVTTKPSARLMGNIRRLEKRLNYTFKHPWLCMQAITHPSWTMFDRAWKREAGADEDGNGNAGKSAGPYSSAATTQDAPPGTVPAQDYQRLEFLGDAVLGWLVTAHLYFASSSFTPAQLTRIKASCVCNASLWVIAIKLDIHNVLRASPRILGNIQSFVEHSRTHPDQGTPPKHPADVLEALFGAVFLDSSCCMKTVSQVFWPLMAQYLQDYPPLAEDELDGGIAVQRSSPPSCTPPSPVAGILLPTQRSTAATPTAAAAAGVGVCDNARDDEDVAVGGQDTATPLAGAERKGRHGGDRRGGVGGDVTDGGRGEEDVRDETGLASDENVDMGDTEGCVRNEDSGKGGGKSKREEMETES